MVDTTMHSFDDNDDDDDDYDWIRSGVLDDACS